MSEPRNPGPAKSTTSKPAAKLGTFTARDSVTIERLLPASAEAVWDYLTNPSRLRTWLAGGTVDLRKGGIIALNFDLIDCPGREDMHGTMQGTITACEPPRLLAYTWGENETRGRGIPDSLVTFELQPAAKGQTLLRLTHKRLAPKDMSPVAAGWHAHVDVLLARLENREPRPFNDSYESLEPQYHAALIASGHKA